MKINHRITASADDPFWMEIDYLGLKYKDGGASEVFGFVTYGISVLNVTEDQPEWPAVEKLLMKYHSSDWATNRFTKRELDTAEWLEVSATGSQGYPKPWNWEEKTYDPRSCGTCGIHGEQLIPYRFSGEPKARSHQFLQLNGIYDVLFVRTEAQEGLTRAGITGIEFGPLLVSAKGAVSKEARQMKILSTLPRAIDTTGMQTITCMPNNEEDYLVSLVWLDEYVAGEIEPPETTSAAEAKAKSCCGQVKYHVQHRGRRRYDRGAFEGAPDVVKSEEWFGSGGLAFRQVLVSQKFRQEVVAEKWRGVVFEPIELVG